MLPPVTQVTAQPIPKIIPGHLSDFAVPADQTNMSEIEKPHPSPGQPQDWNLLLLATSPDGAERVLRFLAGAVGACGGWVLSRSASGDECAEIDFEFPRANCVEVYSVLVAAGIALSQEAHLQLTELCQCTRYLLETRAYDIVRLQLTVLTRTGAAWAGDAATDANREAA